MPGVSPGIGSGEIGELIVKKVVPSSEYWYPVIGLPPSLGTETLTSKFGDDDDTEPKRTDPGSVVVTVNVSDHTPSPISFVAKTR